MTDDLSPELRALLADDWRTNVIKLSKNDPSVRDLDLKFQGLQKEGAQAIALALKHNTHLTKLNLISNHVGDQGAIALATALLTNRTLHTLDISFNEITDNGGKALERALEQNRTLTKVFLLGNAISEETSHRIWKHLQRNKTSGNAGSCGPAKQQPRHHQPSASSAEDLVKLQQQNTLHKERRSLPENVISKARSPVTPAAVAPFISEEEKKRNKEEEESEKKEVPRRSSPSPPSNDDAEEEEAEYEEEEDDAFDGDQRKTSERRLQRSSPSSAKNNNESKEAEAEKGTTTEEKKKPQRKMPPKLLRRTSSLSMPLLKQQVKNLEQREIFLMERNAALEQELNLLRAKLEGKEVESKSLMGEEDEEQGQTFLENLKRSGGHKKLLVRRKKLAIDLTNIQVHEKLAETGGSSASVYACTVDGWQCAMKELDLTHMDPIIKEAFCNEILLLEDLPFHANICRYLFHDLHTNKLRLFMTRYATSLGALIREKRKSVEKGAALRFSSEQIIRYALDLVKGLDFLHKHNIMHRDLKSDNIFVTFNERGEINNLAIGDFDTAKALNGYTIARTIIGTPGYMAPEVLAAQETGAYTYKADIYSFGMIVYELMTLKRPFEDTPHYFVDAKVIQGQRPPLPDHLDPSLETVVDLFESCTEREPNNRPTLRELKEILISSL
ncbi:Ribonuclease inhibitor [Balamuthia mandrillaris]